MDEATMLIVGLRLFLPLVILRFPLFGVLLCAAVDVADYSFTGQYDWYQTADKLLDTYYLTFAAITVLKWKDTAAKRIALGAFAWRLIGVILILLLDERWPLLVFPNFFESFFVFYLLFTYLSGSHRLITSKWRAFTIVAVLLIPKLAQEYILHIYQPAAHAAPAWVTYVVEHFSWAATPLFVIPPFIALIVYLIQTRRSKQTQ